MSDSSGDISILHVDDDSDFLELAKDFVERQDERAVVTTAISAEEGLDELRSNEIDCVVSDFDMPGKNGIEFLEAVREDYPDLPFILYTGKGSEEVASDAISAGVTDYLQKGSGTSQYEVLANRIQNAVAQRRAREEAAETEERLRTIAENTNDILWKFTADWEELLFINSPYEEIWGRMIDELEEQPRSFLKGVHPDDRLDVEKAMERLSAGEPVDFEFRVNADEDFGRWIWVQGEPVFDETGTVDKVVGFARDITDRKQRELELNQSEERYRRLVETSPNPVLITDSAEEFLYVNASACEFLGAASREELIGRDVTEFRDPDHREEIQSRRRELLEKENEVPPMEQTVLDLSGEKKQAIVSSAPVTFDGESAIQTAVTDITERKERTRRLDTLVSNLPGIVYRCRNEPNWPMEFVRGECESLTGYPAEALEKGEVVWGEDILHPDDREEMWDAVQEALAEGRPFEVTYRIQTKDGATRWMWERGQLVDSEVNDGQVLEGFITDITERKRHERELERSRNRYETVFNSTKDAIAWVKFEDETPIIREANPAFEELFAPWDTDVTGMDLDTLVASDDRIEEAREITRRVKQGESLEGEITRDTLDGPRDFRWRAVPIEDPETGEIDSGYAVYTDITDRMEYEQELQQARFRMEFALDATDAIVWVWDIEADETEFYPSAETLYGTPVESWDDFIEIVHPEDRQKVNDSIEQALETGDLKEEEIRIVIDGEVRWIDAPGQPILDDDGPDRMIGVARDITERKRREQQLLEEQAFNQLALDSVIDFYWQLDTDGFVTDWSDDEGRVTGYPTDEAVGMHATEFFPEREQDYIREKVNELLETGSVTAEADFRKKDGELVPYKFDGTVLTNDDGEVDTLCGFGQDITEQVERERELREERDYNAQLIETIPDVFYVAGPDGALREWNDRVPEVTGYSPDEIADMQALEFFAEEDRERVGRAIEETLTTGQATVEADILTINGDRISYEFTGGRLTDSEGDLIGLVGIGRDISERKAHEAELERYETLVEASGDPMYMLDPEGHFRYVNEALADIVGYPKEVLIGAHVEKIMDEADIESGEELIRSLVSSGERRGRFEMEFSTKDGSSIPAENHISLIYDDAEFRGTVGVLRDISDRLERERQLQRERDRLDEFAGVLSHDLRNPLNVAQGRVELAQDDCDSDHLDTVARAHDRMEQLISDVLSLARVGNAIGETDNIELSSLVETCWRNVKTDSAELVVDSDATIRADRTRLQQLIENLLRNAVEHGERDITVTIGELPDGFYLEDDGPGIPEDARSKVLEPGYSTSEEGTGFGLSIVRDIAEAHDWTIDLTEGTDGGARIEFTGVEVE